MDTIKDFFIASKMVLLGKNIQNSWTMNNWGDLVNSEESRKFCYGNLRVELLKQRKTNKIKTILFTSSNFGEGVSTVSFGFAKALSSNSQYKILHINSNLRDLNKLKAKGESKNKKVLAVMPNGKNMNLNFSIEKDNEEGPWLLNFQNYLSDPFSIFDNGYFEGILKRLENYFDFIILDGPPMNNYPDSKLLCELTDSVVMVLEAGKTRRNVALRAKRELEKSGANILGIVLNKRKYYIPDFIYNYL